MPLPLIAGANVGAILRSERDMMPTTTVRDLLGLDLKPDELEVSHMALRGLVVFVFAVVLVRLADRRFLGRNAGFDVMLGIILGSVLSRAINGAAAFFPTLAASAVLVILHHVLGTAACYSRTFSWLVKGKPIILVQDGHSDDSALKRAKITPDDLDENLRINGNERDLAKIAEARLERNGTVSVVKAKTSESRE
jgi:uncharacterized membrane protein YcaP (DUF421 family)